MKTLFKYSLQGAFLLLLSISIQNLNAQAPPLPLEIAQCQDFFGNVEQGNLSAMKECIEKYPKIIEKVNNSGYTPLIVACRTGNTKIVEYLIKKGANVNYKSTDGTSAIKMAAKYGHNEIVKLLCYSGAEEGCDGLSLSIDSNE